MSELNQIDSDQNPNECSFYEIDGKKVLFDKKMKPYLDLYKWRVRKKRHIWYAKTFGVVAGHQITIEMHRLLTCFSKRIVDHINRNGLDNRLANLRLVTYSQNNMNTKMRKGSSEYRGVSRKGRRWQSSIAFEKKDIYLGVFDSELEAAKAYDKASRELHGEYGKRNFGP